MKTETIPYLKNAITRIENGKVSSESGSHLVGIFSKAAKGFEQYMKSYVAELLLHSGIDYEVEIRGLIKGPTFSKATLGQLVAAVMKASKLKPTVVSKFIPVKQSAFIGTLKEINDVWVEIKHGDEIDGNRIVLRMKSMLSLLQQIEAAEPNGGA